jgi:hypothetical protein
MHLVAGIKIILFLWHSSFEHVKQIKVVLSPQKHHIIDCFSGSFCYIQTFFLFLFP